MNKFYLYFFSMYLLFWSPCNFGADFVVHGEAMGDGEKDVVFRLKDKLEALLEVVKVDFNSVHSVKLSSRLDEIFVDEKNVQIKDDTKALLFKILLNKFYVELRVVVKNGLQPFLDDENEKAALETIDGFLKKTAFVLEDLSVCIELIHQLVAIGVQKINHDFVGVELVDQLATKVLFFEELFLIKKNFFKDGEESLAENLKIKMAEILKILWEKFEELAKASFGSHESRLELQKKCIWGSMVCEVRRRDLFYEKYN